jgi:ABC-type multidrug transport system fused ATPase/permease subunit
MEKIAISRMTKNFNLEKKLIFIERYLDLKDDEKSIFMKKIRNEKNAEEIISKFTQTFSTDLPNSELAKILEKRLKGEYSEIALNMEFNLNNIDKFIQSKSLTNTQILEILSKAPKKEYESFNNEIKKTIQEYEYLVSKKKEDVLKNINLHVPKGKTVAFVGETGAGKSTIIKVLTRFYDLKSGEIKIGGINIKDFRLNDLRSIIGMVPQDNYLFSGTILENLYYGLNEKPKLNDKVLKITKNLGIHDFIKELPKQYETQLNEMGTNLSIGQRQLICFARVLMIEPKILLLDEATSSIDPYTEKIIQEAIKKISKGRTTFIIAHRLSTITNADIICVMDNGSIIEQGSHEELIKKKSRYFSLVNSINQ